MNIPARTELMDVMAQLSRLQPYIRLGQLVCHVTTRAGQTQAGAVWDVEDEEMLAAAKSLLADLQRLPPEYHAEKIRQYAECDRQEAAAAG